MVLQPFLSFETFSNWQGLPIFKAMLDGRGVSPIAGAGRFDSRRYVQDSVRMPHRYPEQYLGRTRGPTSSLLPILQRVRADAKQ